jgi:hypothetical protein
MIRRLERLFKRYGKVGPRQISSDSGLVSPSAYVKRFLSLDLAYQRVFDDARDQARRSVLEELGRIAGRVEEVGEIVVLDDRFSLLIQPSVPVAYGYDEYWAFRPDPRKEVGITLGVLLLVLRGVAVVGHGLLRGLGVARFPPDRQWMPLRSRRKPVCRSCGNMLHMEP